MVKAMKELYGIEKMLHTTESLALLGVHEALNPDTGKQLYTNDMTRKAALEEFLANNTEYQESKARARSLEIAIEQIKLTMELHNRKMRFLQALIPAFVVTTE